MSQFNYQNIVDFIKNDNIQMMTPDYDEIANLVSIAKGSKPSNVFAREIGVSEPQMSRILNGKITHPISLDTIIEIITHADIEIDDSFVHSLLSANGYVSKYEQEKIRSQFIVRQRQSEVDNTVGQLMSLMIKAALLDRGQSISSDRIDADSQGAIDTCVGKPIKYNFCVPIIRESYNFDWYFLVFTQTTKYVMSCYESIDKAVDALIKQASAIFLTDAWSPTTYENKKISFCFCDTALYNAFNEKMKNAYFNNRFSSILTNTDKKQVDENVFAGRGFDEYIFNQPSKPLLIFKDDDVVGELNEDGLMFVVEEEEEDT